MSKASHIYNLVLELPSGERAALVCDILDTLPAGEEHDDHLAEARRRSREMDENPVIATLSLCSDDERSGTAEKAFRPTSNGSAAMKRIFLP
jgi:hypothetical protein